MLTRMRTRFAPPARPPRRCGRRDGSATSPRHSACGPEPVNWRPPSVSGLYGPLQLGSVHIGDAVLAVPVAVDRIPYGSSTSRLRCPRGWFADGVLADDNPARPFMGRGGPARRHLAQRLTRWSTAPARARHPGATPAPPSPAAPPSHRPGLNAGAAGPVGRLAHSFPAPPATRGPSFRDPSRPGLPSIACGGRPASASRVAGGSGAPGRPPAS
jgi:hypothetical protein